jgi:hypothetical protein
MNSKLFSALVLSTALAAGPVFAQFTLPGAGNNEFTLGGGGTMDRDFDDSSGGVSFSYGKYSSSAWLWSLRQTLSYAHAEDSDTVWNGSTRAAVDYHFGAGSLRPLVGANLGYIYGESVSDSLAAGVEGGLKYYVSDRTFIHGLLEYAWLFDDADDIDDTFDDGGYGWTVGIGFNF